MVPDLWWGSPCCHTTRRPLHQRASTSTPQVSQKIQPGFTSNGGVPSKTVPPCRQRIKSSRVITPGLVGAMRRKGPYFWWEQNHVCTLLIWVAWFLTCGQLTYMFYDCLDLCLLQLYRMLYRMCIQVICLCVGMVLAGWVDPLYSNLPFQPKKVFLDVATKQAKNLSKVTNQNHGTSRTLLRSKWRFGFHHVENLIFHVVHRGNVRTCHRGNVHRFLPTCLFWISNGFLLRSPVGLLTAKAWRLLGRSSWWQIHLSLGTDKNWHWVRMESIENLVIATSC